MSYCDFRLNLFQQYTSHKTKINPELSDDWELINKAYNTTDGVALKSNKLDQTVYDIPMRRFIEFCKKFEVTVVGNLLQGEFAVGQDRSVYVKEDYDKWKSKYDKRSETIISVKDAKVGHIYRTICGLSVIYLGSKYSAKWKDDLRDKKYTNIAKVHYVHIMIDFEDDNPQYGVQPKGSLKFIRDMGYALDQDEIDNVFKHYLHSNRHLVYFADKSVKNPKYGYVETEAFSYSYMRKDYTTMKTFLEVIPYNELFTFANGKYYQVKYQNNSRSGSTEFNDKFEFVEYHRVNYGYHHSSNYDKLVPEKFFRIGLVGHG